MSFLDNAMIRQEIAKMTDDEKIALIQQYPELLDRKIRPILQKTYTVDEILRLNTALNSGILGETHPGISEKFIVEIDPTHKSIDRPFVRRQHQNLKYLSDSTSLNLEDYSMFDVDPVDPDNYDCTLKRIEYHEVCDPVWNERCSFRLNPEQNAEIRKQFFECGKKRYQWIKQCEPNSKSHLSALNRMSSQIKECDKRTTMQEEGKLLEKITGTARPTYKEIIMDGIFHLIPKPIPTIINIMLHGLKAQSECVDSNVVMNLLQPYIIPTPARGKWRYFKFIPVSDYHYIPDEELDEMLPGIIECLFAETFRTNDIKMRRLIRRWIDEDV